MTLTTNIGFNFMRTNAKKTYSTHQSRQIIYIEQILLDLKGAEVGSLGFSCYAKRCRQCLHFGFVVNKLFKDCNARDEVY